jgi:hypothetical protein
MKAFKVSSWIVLSLILLAPLDVSAAPPKTGGSSWFKPPAWNMPTMPWSKAKAPARKKSPGMMNTMSKSAQQGWSKTKKALNPARIMPSDSKATKPTSASAKKNEDGFFSGMFGGKKKPEQEVKTVNDFLAQPKP